MDNIVLGQVQQSVVNIFYYGVGFRFFEHFGEFELIFEVALVAKLSNDVTVAIAGEDLETLEDAGMVEFL